MSPSPFTPDHCPRLRRGVRLGHDHTRNTAILNAPERIVVLDDIAQNILRRCDGKTPIRMMATSLAADHDAKIETVEADIIELMGDLSAQGMVE